MIKIPKQDRKAWARKQFRGFENILLPSFTADFQGLDEAGIAYDVRQSIKHGCFSVFAVPLALSLAEQRHFLEVVVTAAGGDVTVGLPLMEPSIEGQYKLLDIAEQTGCSHVLIHPPFEYHAESEDQLYEYYRELIESTDLGVVLWATDGTQFTHLHPSNVVLSVFDRLADLPNVVAIKLMATLSLPTVYECCERLHDRVLIGSVSLGLMPLLVKHYGVQWSGAWTIEALQSPEKPYVVEYLDNLIAGREAEAMKIFWKIKPAYDALFVLMAPMLPKGIHPNIHLKYYQWAVGGNGGLLREPMDPKEAEFPLQPHERDSIKAALRSIDLEPREDEESFLVGTANYEKGICLADLARVPMYVT